MEFCLVCLLLKHTKECVLSMHFLLLLLLSLCKLNCKMMYKRESEKWGERVGWWGREKRKYKRENDRAKERERREGELMLHNNQFFSSLVWIFQPKLLLGIILNNYKRKWIVCPCYARLGRFTFKPNIISLFKKT